MIMIFLSIAVIQFVKWLSGIKVPIAPLLKSLFDVFFCVAFLCFLLSLDFLCSSVLELHAMNMSFSVVSIDYVLATAFTREMLY